MKVNNSRYNVLYVYCNHLGLTKNNYATVAREENLTQHSNSWFYFNEMIDFSIFYYAINDYKRHINIG